MNYQINKMNHIMNQVLMKKLNKQLVEDKKLLKIMKMNYYRTQIMFLIKKLKEHINNEI